MKTCSVEGCGRKRVAKGLCRLHWNRSRAGRPLSAPVRVHGRPLADRFWEKVDKTGECWLWRAHLGSCGYGAFGLGGRAAKAHRVAFELTHGPIPPGLFVCHSCDVPACVRPEHLFLGTHVENMADMRAKGRSPDHRGTKNTKAKLTPDLVRHIRARLSTGESRAQIARSLGVWPTTISMVALGRRWADVPQEAPHD